MSKFPYMIEEPYEGGYKRKTLGNKNTSAYENLDNLVKPRSKYTVNDLLKELTNIRKQIQKLNSSIAHQKKRADKWMNKYKKDIKNYDKIMLDNDQLHTTNNELNLMHHQAVIKILNLGQEIKKLNDLKKEG